MVQSLENNNDSQFNFSDENLIGPLQNNLSKSISNINNSSSSIRNILATQGANLSREEIMNYKEALNQQANLQNNMISSAGSQGQQLDHNLRAASNNLVNQMVITDILQNEVNNAEQSYFDLKQDNNNKLRMVEINRYYTNKYRAQTELMQLIIFFAVPLLLITILVNKNILPQNIGYILGGVILFVGVFMVINKIIDINSRNNIDFNEYDFNVNVSNVESNEKGNQNSPTIGSGIQQDAESSLKALEKQLGITCNGSDCCNPNFTTWNKDLNTCVPKCPPLSDGRPQQWQVTGTDKNMKGSCKPVYEN